MAFYWYDTHLLKLLHAIWSPSTLKIGEVETKGVKKHICKRRPREEEAECPHNRYNEVKMWMFQGLLGWVQGCESCGWKTLRKSHRLRGGSSGAHNEPRIHRIESIQTAFLPNLWTEDPSVPFSLQFGSILTSLCGDKDFFLRPWVIMFTACAASLTSCLLSLFSLSTVMVLLFHDRSWTKLLKNRSWNSSLKPSHSRPLKHCNL